jgi:hypothetical protein
MNKMLTETQIKKAQKLIDATQFLFSHKDFGIQQLSFNKFWVVGDILRNLLLQDNPYIHNYSYYLQLFKKEELDIWVAQLRENNIPCFVTENKVDNGLFSKEVWATVSFSLLEFGIEHEFEVFVGSDIPQNFIERLFPVNVSQLGLDVFKVNVAGFNAQNLKDATWSSSAFDEAMTHREIKVVRPELKDNVALYEQVITPYLKRTYEALKSRDFTLQTG